MLLVAGGLIALTLAGGACRPSAAAGAHPRPPASPSAAASARRQPAPVSRSRAAGSRPPPTGAPERGAIVVRTGFEEHRGLDPFHRTGSGRLTIDDTRAHGGARSLRVESRPGWDGRAFLTLEDERLRARPELWLRAFLFIEATAADGVHWNHFQARGEAEDPEVHGGKAFTAQLAHGGMHHGRYLQNYDTPGGYTGAGPRSDCWRNSKHSMPVGRWVCLEWHIDRDRGLVESYQDGQLLTDQTVRQRSDGCLAAGTGERWVYPRLTTIEIGWAEFGQGARPHTLWVDDVAIAGRRMPCSMAQ